MPRAETKTNFATIKLFETKKENEFQQTANSKQQTANCKQQTANGRQKTANSKQRRIFGKIFGEYSADYQDIRRITMIFGRLP